MSLKISVITATYNAANHLPSLIDSLRKQNKTDFEWVVADGGSTDGTLSILDAVTDLDIVVTSQADFGIYDALNRAIKLSRADYYVVIGSDDVFEDDALERFSRAIDNHHRVITTPIIIGDKKYGLSKLPVFLSGFRSKICGHSIATLFQKSLHEDYGYYSNKYPIAADYDFMMKLVCNNVSIKACNFVAGRFGLDGLSTVDRIGSASEVMRIMVANGFSTTIQVMIFILRLLYSALVTRRHQA